MTSPHITASIEGEVVEKAPPPLERRKPHKWLSEKSLAAYRETRPEAFQLYISKVAEEKMRNHALHHCEEKKEVMGLMLGGIYRYERREFSLVREVVTTDLDASAVRVKFQKDAFEKLFESLDHSGFNYIIVGWYHSHPGYGCFMSSTDVHTQQSMFNQPFHSAVVIDPVNKEIEAFALNEEKIESKVFAIYWDEFQNPYYGTTVRLRKLRSNPDGVPLP